jgi:hypothetical protein
MTSIVVLAWSAGTAGLVFGGVMILTAICFATWAMTKARTPLVGDEHH